MAKIIISVKHNRSKILFDIEQNNCIMYSRPNTIVIPMLVILALLNNYVSIFDFFLYFHNNVPY